MRTIRTTRDLYAEGLTKDDLSSRVRASSLVRVRPGVYATAEKLTPEQAHRRLVEATLPALARDAVAAGVSAAVLLGLPVDAARLGRVEAIVPGRSHGRTTTGLHQRREPLPESAITTVDGLRCTAPARTAVDLARSQEFGWGVAACDAVLHRRLATADDLATTLDTLPRRHGTPRARAALAFADARAESVLESISRVQIRRLGFPAPELQFPIEADGVLVARTDFAWPGHGVVGEADRAVKYADQAFDERSGAQVFADEKRREEAIREQGWWIVRWDWAAAHHERTFERRLRSAFDNGRRRAA